MTQTRVYDWNGVFITIDGFWGYLNTNHPDVFHGYKTLGDKDREVKRNWRDKMLPIYEDATNRGLYPVELVPHVKERLAADQEQGYARTIFTSAPRATVEKQIGNLGLSVDNVIVLSDVQAEFALPRAMKEDPTTFEALAHYVRKRGMGESVSYVDDAEKRIQAAVQANLNLTRKNEAVLGTLFLFDPKATASPVPSMGYTTINDLLHIH